jgi:mono/diheme cytochrome c family protein
MLLMAAAGDTLNANPARARPHKTAAPTLPAVEPAARGHVLWLDHCAGCHGAEGRGDGPAAAWLLPRPPSLAVREFTADHLARALWNGVAATSMPGWRDYPLEDLAALAAVVRGFSQVEAEPPNGATLAPGERVYRKHCEGCHGTGGAGDGFAAAELPIAPTDFRGRRTTFTETLRVLEDGVEGTSMAPWTDRLTGEERSAVAHYVRSLFAEEAR